MVKNILHTIKLALLVSCMFFVNKTEAQTVYATPAQKAQGRFITQQVKDASTERRQEQGNESGSSFAAPTTYQINGPEETIERYSTQSFYSVPPLPLGAWWYISNGTVVEYFDDIMTINFYTSAPYVDVISFSSNDTLLAKVRVYVISASDPLSAGQILTGSQYIHVGDTATNIHATLAVGGECSGAFLYQWQFSYNDSTFRDIEDATADSLLFESYIDQTVYFRRKVVCGIDSQYTGSVAVFLIPNLAGGSITTTNQTIFRNTTPPPLNTTSPANGNCFVYQYQWQKSTDGQTFSDISGATITTYSPNSAIAENTYYRRKVSCVSETAYTNIILIRVKDPVSNVQVQSRIDSLINSAGVDLATIFNLQNDSIANNRLPANLALDSLEESYYDKQQLFSINNTYSSLTTAQLNEIQNAPAVDSIDYKTNPANHYFDSATAYIPFLDSATIDGYRLQGNYAGLDSIVKQAPKISFEEASHNLEAQLYSLVPDSLRSYNPQLNLWNTRPSIVINGPVLCNYFQTAHYTASFYYPPGSNANIEWVVSGGTVIAQNTIPANGIIYIDILWQNNFTGTRSLMIYERVSEEYGTLLPMFKQRDCLIFPSQQELYFGQTPNYLNVAPCYNTGNVNFHFWQQLDVYSSNTWTPIAGSNSETYQPAPLSRPWMMYRRITITGVDDVFISSAASVKLHKVDAGVFTAAASNVTYNTIPTVTMARAASGGMLVPPGATYTYTWESSINNGAWQQIGTGATFPNYAITQAQQIRWVVTITGVPQSVYSLPEEFWKGYSQPIEFTVNGQNPSTYENRNFIRENTVLTRGINTWEATRDLATEKKIQNTTYLDGLSRPIQVVGKGTHFDEAANQWYDMVQDVTYEAGGRVDKALLPYPTTFNLGKFKTNVVTEQPAYFQNKFGDATAFAKVEYDNSPLNIVKKSFAPGDGWGGGGTNVSGKMEIYTSVEEVYKFTIGYAQGEIPVKAGVYPSNTLIKSVGTDEKGKKVVTYSDKIGNTILKKVQLAEGAQLSEQHNGWLCTYYVYDDFGQLRFTVTPKAVKEIETNNWVITNIVANELCYWYDYDDLGRTIAKKTPGKGAEYVLYNKRNRPVFTTDAALISASSTDWLTTLYDDLDRPVISGIYKTPNQTTNAPDIAGLQNLIDNAAINVQVVSTTYGGNARLWNSPLTASVINNNTSFTQLSFKYYDDYTYSGAKTFNITHTQNLAYKNISAIVGNVEPMTQTKRYNGMLTGQKVRVLNDNNSNPTFLTTTIFFDEEASVIQGQEDNIKGGVEITSSQYHFDGRVLSTSETHAGELAPFNNFNILTKYKFDKIGRVIGIAKKLINTNRNYNGSTFDSNILEDADAEYKVLASYKYNELNQRSKKILSPNYNGGQGLETLEYSYNIRGWLTGINKDYALGEQNSNQWQHYFGMYLGYDNRDNKFAAAQYNGSITGVMWKSQGDNTPRKFDYEYDNANRLIAANFNQRGIAGEVWNRNKVDFSSKNISYDENGNLLSLTQMGILPGGTAPIEMDKLNYVYYNQSNRLKRVDDVSSNPANGKQGDFIDKNHNLPIDDYNYDNNGRLIFDNNKNISQVTYNYLDKPTVITIPPPQGSSTGGGTVKYIYNAGGEKLQKIVTENPSTANNNQQRIVTTTYISGFIYEKTTVAGNTSPDAVRMIQLEEGRIRIVEPYSNPADPGNEISGGISLSIDKMAIFDYFIKDNLGNVRATLTEELNKAAATCTMEDAVPAIKDREEALFGNPGANNEVATTRFTKPQPWQANLSDRVSKLQATGGIPKTGPNAILHVMAGDKIRAKADYYYQTDPGSNGSSNTSLQALLNSLITTISGGGRTSVQTHGQETQITGQLQNDYYLQSMFNNPPAGSNPNPNAPRAYLNYIFFDEQFNFVPELSGFKRVSQAGDGVAPLVLTEAKATKNGYVYIYLSNESAEPVYFDNFAVAHDRGQLISEDHYYAYGLKIASISSKSISSSLNPSISKRGYQGSFSEEVTEFELNYNEFELRTYDPQIGRWTTPDPYDEFASPYLGMGNDPINNVDPTGGFIVPRSSGIVNHLSATLKVLVAATTVTAGLATGIGQFNMQVKGSLINLQSNNDPPRGPLGGLLYKTADHAAVAWARQMASNTARNQREYSSMIFRIKIKERFYYGFTIPASLDDENTNFKSSPGPYHSLQNKIPTGAEPEAHIHSHTGEKGELSDNDNFSKGRNEDTDIIDDFPELDFYVVGNLGTLRKDGANIPLATGFKSSLYPKRDENVKIKIDSDGWTEYLEHKTPNEKEILTPVGEWYYPYSPPPSGVTPKSIPSVMDIPVWDFRYKPKPQLPFTYKIY